MGDVWGLPTRQDIGSAAAPAYSFRELSSTGMFALKAGWGGVSTRKALVGISVSGTYQAGITGDGQLIVGGFVDIGTNYKIVSYGDLMSFTGCMTTYNDASSNANTRGFSISLNGNETARYTTTNTDVQITGPGGVILQTINHATKTVKFYGLMDGPPNDYAKAQYTLNGGGRITWQTPGGYFNFTARMLCIPIPNLVSTRRYFHIYSGDRTIPAANVYSTGVARQWTAANGIILNAWEALWVIHTLGGDDVSISFAITNFESTFVAPSNWILIAVANGDDASLKLGMGVNLPPNSMYSADTGLVSRLASLSVSDQNLAGNMRSLNAAELAAWAFITPMIFNLNNASKLTSSVLGQYIEYFFSSQGLNVDNYTLVQKYSVGGVTQYSVRMDECFAWEMAYQRSRQAPRVQREALTVTAANTLSALSKLYSGQFAELIVNGVEYASYSAKQPFTIQTGSQTVNWNATNAGYTLKTTDDVVIRYGY